PQGRTELDPLADNRLVRDIDDRLSGLRLDALPDIGMNIGPSRHIINGVSLRLEHPEDRVASGMNEALERPAVPLQVDQYRRVHLVPIPCIILMVLMVRLDLAGRGVKRENRAGVEIVAGVGIARPGRGVSDAPIDGLGVLVVGAGHPGGAAALLPVIALPGVMARLALARDGKGPP